MYATILTFPRIPYQALAREDFEAGYWPSGNCQWPTVKTSTVGMSA